MNKEKRLLILIISCFSVYCSAQSPLAIPPTMTGPVFNLNIQNGTTSFYSGINTPTYGINGALLAPTLIVDKWDTVTMNVTNNLTGFGNSTTIHWHGLHVPASADGGPHQIINQGTTWSPVFRILNAAGTFWYHPHGDNKTDLHVSKGIAGMIIVRDSVESALTLPRTYGVDDFPIIIQTKAFDILNQIAISSELDTVLCVNGIVQPYLNIPSQVVRLRLLNGSSSRTYRIGFTANQSFKMIAGDAGLLDSSITLTRLNMSPGERAEILLDLQGMNGQTIYLRSYASELPNGVHGAATVTGPLGGTIPDYALNPLNGADLNVLQLNIGAQTTSPVTTIPTMLSPVIPWTGFTVSRTFNLDPDTLMNASAEVIGPFNINGKHFDMDSINVRCYLNDVEKWKIVNNTGIAHPFHIHDMHFYLLNVNGGPVQKEHVGKKDVVLVMPGEYVEFITRFEDFADDHVPYMYHCHLLHHEDDGMMGSFVVIDSTSNIHDNEFYESVHMYPNPGNQSLTVVTGQTFESAEILVYDVLGHPVMSKHVEKEDSICLDITNLTSGVYFISVSSGRYVSTRKFLKQ